MRTLFIRTLSCLCLFTPLLPAQEPQLRRGPYLQQASPAAITVCWRTDFSVVGRVRYGTAPDALTGMVEESAAAVDHRVRLTGLSPATRYYYRIEAGASVLAGGSSCFFTTPPVEGAADALRFWVLGDSGTQTTGQRLVRDAFAPVHTQRPADLWLMLGDNAYYNGTDALFQGAVFNMYPDYLRTLPLWSCLGNHETYAGLNGNGQFAYEDIFVFPAAGESGGVASGTERYYSFNWGRVHFISLDSMTASRAADGAMAQWLTLDLQANVLPWVVAFWHHPPYSKGTHNSDIEIELIEMRQNILPILENHGVDLVLCGHSHNYERSWLLDGHYGLSPTLAPVHKKGPGDGREGGDGPYFKAGAGMTPRQGAVYITAGSSGQAGGGALNHPAHFIALSRMGSLVVDVSGDRMDVKFLREATVPVSVPVYDDFFSIIKGTPPPPAPVLTRGPYLQKAAPTAITLRWRTEQPAAGRVRYGLSPGALTLSAVEPAPPVADYSVRLTGLSPQTKYYYSIESAGHVLASGPDCFFTTPPPAGNMSPVRIWVLGDSGTVTQEQLAVRDAFIPVHAQRPASLWLMLGDNAYGSGLDSEYQDALFNVYQPWLRQLHLWSCIGNHETYGAPEGVPYAWDRIFDFPAAGECGGVASGTERYYSWDHGNIHFVALDSMTSSRAANGPMALWLAADLQANLLPWTIAFWHHPPYTRGSHDSDVEEELIEMRQNILPILEQHGVDLALCGHSHSYERSYLLDGQYGTSDTLLPQHLLDAGDGRPAGDGAYRKPGTGPLAHRGAVYVVAGSSGQVSGGPLDHPAHFVSLDQLGSLVIDVDNLRMDVKFLRETADPQAPPVFADTFTIEKGGPVPPAAPDGLAVLFTDANSAMLHWEDRATTESSYRIELSPDGLTWESAAEVPADHTSFLLAALPAAVPRFVRVTAINASGSAVSQPFSFTHPGSAAATTPIQRWRFAFWGSVNDTGDRADLADADADGFPNLMEYALASHPRSILSQPATAAALTPAGRLAFTFTRVADPALSYAVEFCPDLTPASWAPGFVSTGAANSAGPVTVTDAALPPARRRFARVKITLQPVP
jgi:3',5'-cyclic AMP phosphodiesterase CpdA